MKKVVRLTALVLLFIGSTGVLSAQGQDEGTAAATQPPRLLLLVHQEFQPGKAGARQKLSVAIARACDRLKVPNSWIDLEALTGRSEAVSFDPFDSFADIDKAAAEWPRIFAENPDIGRLQDQLDALVSVERTLIAVRRDDVGYRANTIDLSRAHVMRVLEVHLFSGHEGDFVEAFRALAGAYERINSDTPWVVYQVNVGAPTPMFLVFLPMSALAQNDELLSRRGDLLSAEGEESAQRMQQIAREAYAGTESNLYLVSPKMSHVPREFADGDPDFWKSRAETPAAGPTEKKPEKPEARKN